MSVILDGERHHNSCRRGEHACYCWCHFRDRPNKGDVEQMDYQDAQIRRSQRALRQGR